MQGLHAAYAVASTVAPFLASLLLVELKYDRNQTDDGTGYIHGIGSSDNNFTLESTNTTDNNNNNYSINTLLYSIHNNTYQDIDTSRVQYIYIMYGIVLFIPAIFFFGIYMLDRKPLIQTKKSDAIKQASVEIPPPVESTLLKTIIWGGMGVYCVFGRAVWVVPGDLIASVMVKMMGWTVKASSWLTGVFWLGYLTGNIVGTLATLSTGPVMLLRVCLLLTTLAFGVLCFLPILPEWLIWTSIALSGAAQAPMFPCLVVWVARYIPTSGFSTGVFFFLVSAGGTVTSAVLPVLFQNVSQISVVYVPMVTVLLMALGVLVMQVSAYLLDKPCSPKNIIDSNGVSVPLTL